MRNLLLVTILALTACSATPRAVSERDMQGLFSTDATAGRRALLAEFLPDGRFGGDLPQPGETIRTQGYWRIGAVDAKRGCTIVETKLPRGEWREGFCASIEGERTALNCTGEDDGRTCLMVRRPSEKPSSTVTLGNSVPADRR
jgi:hypothetical protein